jgi:prevent-host-death family protein
MITINQKTTIASLSELRTKSEQILKTLTDHRVILQKHNKPVAVILSIDQYLKLEKLLRKVDDKALGEVAQKRDKTSRPEDFVDLKEW